MSSLPQRLRHKIDVKPKKLLQIKSHSLTKLLTTKKIS